MQISFLADLATIFASIAVITAVVRLMISFKQLKADHERSRREKSVDLLLEWSKELKKEGSIARKIVETLNEEQCREIFSQEKVSISEKQIKLLEQFFDESTLNKSNGDVTLSESQASELRWHAISYLNSLEAVLVAWQYSVVDRGVIERQFSYLFRPDQGHAALKHFRTAAGGEESFPAIEIFSNHLEQKRRLTLQQKANVA